MPISHNRSLWFLSALLLALPSARAVGPTSTPPNPLDQAQHQVTAYLATLADLHCTESVTQEKLGGNGHVEALERAKYDYLIMMDGNGDDFHLNESRIESSATRAKPVSMLTSDGIATVLLVFHPYYRDSFTFDIGVEEMVDGKPAIPVHFTQIPGRRSPAALALGGRQYPLELEGKAWLDKQSGEVVKIDANLLHDMTDVGLRSIHLKVDYKPTTLGKNPTTINLPAVAIVEVTTPRQHWRNTHIYDSYKTFSTDVEQGPGVTIHAEKTPTGSDNTTAMVTTEQKEKP